MPDFVTTLFRMGWMMVPDSQAIGECLVVRCYDTISGVNTARTSNPSVRRGYCTVEPRSRQQQRIISLIVRRCRQPRHGHALGWVTSRVASDCMPKYMLGLGWVTSRKFSVGRAGLWKLGPRPCMRQLGLHGCAELSAACLRKVHDAPRPSRQNPFTGFAVVANEWKLLFRSHR